MKKPFLSGFNKGFLTSIIILTGGMLVIVVILSLFSVFSFYSWQNSETNFINKLANKNGGRNATIIIQEKKLYHLLSPASGYLTNSGKNKREIFSFKNDLLGVISQEEMDAIVSEGMRLRLAENYLNDVLVIAKIFSENPGTAQLNDCILMNNSYTNPLYKNERNEEFIEACTIDTKITYSEEFNELALLKFDEFLANAWIDDAYIIYHYFLSLEDYSDEVKDILKKNYLAFLEANQGKDADRLAELFVNVNNEFFVASSDYAETDYSKTAVIQNDAGKIEKVIVQTLPVFTEEEVKKFFSVKETWTSSSDLIELLDLLDKPEDIDRIAREIYLAYLDGAYEKAAEIREYYNLSFDDFEKKDLLAVVAEKNYCGVYLEFSDYNIYDEIRELLKYLGKDLNDSEESVLTFAKHCLSEEIKYSDDALNKLEQLLTLQEKYPNYLSNKVIVNDEELRETLLDVVSQAVVTRNINIDGRVYHSSIIAVYNDRKRENIQGFYIDKNDVDLIVPDTFINYFNLLKNNNIGFDELKENFLQWETLYLSFGIGGEGMFSRKNLGVIKEFERRFLSNVVKEELKQAKLDAIDRLLKKAQETNDDHYKKEYYVERIKDIKDEFDVVWSDYSKIMKENIDLALQAEDYVRAIEFIVFFDNQEHELLNYLNENLDSQTKLNLDKYYLSGEILSDFSPYRSHVDELLDQMIVLEENDFFEMNPEEKEKLLFLNFFPVFLDVTLPNTVNYPNHSTIYRITELKEAFALSDEFILGFKDQDYYEEYKNSILSVSCSKCLVSRGEIEENYKEWEFVMDELLPNEDFDYEPYILDYLDFRGYTHNLKSVLTLIDAGEASTEFLQSQEVRDTFFEGLNILFLDEVVDYDDFHRLKSYIIFDEATEQEFVDFIENNYRFHDFYKSERKALYKKHIQELLGMELND